MNSFSFIIATHNNEKDILNTYLTVMKAIGNLNIKNYEIIFVNNASTDKTQAEIREVMAADVRVKYCFEPQIGLSKAIYTGVNLSNFEFCLPLPGHDMHTFEGIIRVCTLAERGSLVLGYRTDKLRNRPLVKVLASHIYVYLCNKLLNLNFKDVNGLILFPTDLLKANMDPRLGHGHAIFPLVRLARRGLRIKQVPIMIKNDHKKREGANWRWHFPKFSNVLSAINALIKLRAE